MKKLLSFIFAIAVFSLSLLPMTAFAVKEDWEISSDGQILTNGSTVYQRYVLPGDTVYYPDGEVYLFEVEKDDEEYYYDYVAVTPDNKDVVGLHYGEEAFVTEKGKEILDSFKAGEYSYYLYSSGEDAVKDFTEADFSLFIKEENKTEVDVSEIWNYKIDYVRGFDRTGTFAHACGAVYELNDGYYYIHFDELDNSYFDAYGNFSYRRGMSPAYKLDEQAENFVITARASSKARVVEYLYPEEEPFFYEEDSLSATITFWVISGIFGLIIPLAPFILSIKFAHSKKSLHPKRWYLLTLCSVIWILVSAAIVLTFIL